MFKNYFKITCRILLRQKVYTIINVGGLAIGIACFIAIFLYISHELSYDRHFRNADSIYRIYSHEQSGATYLGTDKYATIPLPLATAIKYEFPEVLHLTSFEPQATLLSSQNGSFNEDGLWVDTDFFEVFSFQFAYGNPKTALSQPESIVLTESLAQKLFGDSNPIGKMVSSQIRHEVSNFTVTGTIKDPPENTSLKFSFFAPIRSYVYYANEWNTSNSHTFMVLTDGTHPKQIEAKMPDLLKKYQVASLWTDYHKEEYLLQPLLEYHLENQVNDDVGIKGNPQQVRIFSIVAVLVLLLGCVNYMNLAIARSMNRTQEVGLRKVIGAKRRQLILQFLGESILLSSIALLVSLTMLAVVLPIFSEFVDRPIELNIFDNKVLLPGLFLLVLVVGFLSGSYPAFFMSKLRPINSLKGTVSMGKTSFYLQKILIVGQYAVSISMIIISLVIYYQYGFIQQKEVGYDKEHIIAIRIQDIPSLEQHQTLKNQWLANPNIQSVTASTELPVNVTSSTVINYEGRIDDDPLVIYRLSVDHDFLDTYGIELVAGRDPSKKSTRNLKNLLFLNESGCKALNWDLDEAIGQEIKHRGTVMGVVKDFHMLSMHHAIEPLMLQIDNQAWLEYISVKIHPKDLPSTILQLENSVNRISNFPFEYKFLDDTFDQLYKADIHTGKVLGVFTGLSIFIASLGLFGLAVLSANQRTKEIGIRKVLGASISTLIKLMSGDFLMMVLLGFIIASPIAWYFTSKWLAGYTYKITLEWWMFALPGLTVVILAFLTISLQSIKAALNNPVDCLRDE